MSYLPDPVMLMSHSVGKIGQVTQLMLLAGQSVYQASYFLTASSTGIIPLASVDASCTASQSFVQDALAPPTTKPSIYRTIPRAVPLKHQSYKRKLVSGGGGIDEGEDGSIDGPITSGGGFDGLGGSWNWNGGGGGWGNNSWHDWDEEWYQRQTGQDKFALLYRIACWLSLSRCLVHAMVSSAGKVQTGREETSVADALREGAFASCVSALTKLPLYRKNSVACSSEVITS